MKALTEELRQGLGVAFNEATLLGVEVSPERSLCGITLALLTLPENGPAPDDSRIQVLLHPVGRVVASLRMGRWDDDSATVQPFELTDLLSVVQSFQGLPIYGWEFFDLSEDKFKGWSNRLSLDWHGEPEGMAHSVFLFQEGSAPERTLDLRVWFREIEFRRPDGTPADVEDVASGGRRWWDALFAGDARAQGHGIFPMKPDGGQPDAALVREQVARLAAQEKRTRRSG
jgi:hypothetical protein